MTPLDYAREIERKFGPSVPVTWINVGELIELLEKLEDKNLHHWSEDPKYWAMEEFIP